MDNPIIAGSSILRVEHFDCECHSYDHGIRFAFDPTETDIRCLEIWVDAHFPNNHSLWQRIVMAAKYIFKKGKLDWTYGSWILKHEDEARLKNFFREYDLAVWKLRMAQVRQQAKEGDDAVTKNDSLQ